jgi:hypothetical protein
MFHHIDIATMMSLTTMSFTTMISLPGTQPLRTFPHNLPRPTTPNQRKNNARIL